ncbi:MAG: universal stress protein [Bacteroidota bacterium]
MQTIKRILLPTDFSETATNAFKYALLLADQLDAEIRLLYCLTPAMAVSGVPNYSANITEKLFKTAQDNMLQFMEQGIAEVIGQLDTMPSVTEKVEVGAIVESAKSIAESYEYDLIVMGTKGADSVWDEWFGSISSALLMNAPCPVLIIPSTAQFFPYERICYATDVTWIDTYEGSDLMAAFSPMKPNLHFLHVNQELSEAASVPLENVNLVYDQRNLPYEVSVAEVTAKDVPAAIIEEAENMVSDMIVMMRPHYNFFEQIFHKSKTREVALHSSIPLLVINEGPEMEPGFN